LGKRHADELLTASEVPDARLCVVALDQAGESFAVDKVENLRKDVAASVHPRAFQQMSYNSNA
jgi:hypothetical protein